MYKETHEGVQDFLTASVAAISSPKSSKARLAITYSRSSCKCPQHQWSKPELAAYENEIAELNRKV